MAARRAAFSDPEVAALLAGSFVPVAENCTLLQRQQDAEGDLFRLVAEQGHYAGRFIPTDTRQGQYALTPDGVLLASCNVHGADRLLAMLQRALQRWESGRGAAGAGPAAADGATDPRYVRRPPDGGLVLRVWVRDLPRDPDADARPDDWRRTAFNLDHAWFTAEEAESLVPAPPAPGAEAPWPPALARRLARFHCIDNVRGEPPMWRPDEVQRAEVRSVVAGVDGGAVTLRLQGSVGLRGSARWVDDWSRRGQQSDRGIELELSGTARWDRAAARFQAFELLATGTRWGGTKYNSRNDDPGPAPIGYAFELSGAPPVGSLPGDATPPQGVGAGYFRGE